MMPPLPARGEGGQRIDIHVHIVGVGAGGTGCRMKTGGWRWPLETLMFHHIGLSRASLRGDFDRIYADHLLELVRGSSLDAAVILALDEVRDETGAVMKGGALYVPNEYVLRLAREHPEFLAGVSIHPARPDAMEELERCLDGGAALLKLLPNCQNVNCNDRRYARFWERMAEAGLPFLAHTGGEHTLPIINAKYADPRVLELPLECGVKVVAAHSATRSGLFDPDYLEVLVEMMRKFPRLYADNSAFNIPLRSGAFRRSMEAPLSTRMLHGSDFPVPIYPHWARLRGLITAEDFDRCRNVANVLERDIAVKRAIGVRADTFTRATEILRPAPARSFPTPAS